MENYFWEVATELAELLAERFCTLADDDKKAMVVSITEALTNETITAEVYAGLLKQARELKCHPDTLSQMSLAIFSFRTIAGKNLVDQGEIISATTAILGDQIGLMELSEIHLDSVAYQKRVPDTIPKNMATDIIGAVSLKRNIVHNSDLY